MTEAQRKQFSKRLEEIFGDVLKKDRKEIETTFEGTGWILYEFIQPSTVETVALEPKKSMNQPY